MQLSNEASRKVLAFLGYRGTKTSMNTAARINELLLPRLKAKWEKTHGAAVQPDSGAPAPAAAT